MLALIIAARNEEKSLPKTLQSLAEQKCHMFSLILVDNGSSDATLKCIKRFQKANHGIDVHIVIEPRAGRINALRAGIACAHRIPHIKVVAFSDADALFNPLWSLDVTQSYEKDPEAGFGYANEHFNKEELKDIPHFAYCLEQFAQVRHHIRSYVGGIMILNNCWVRLDLLHESSFEDEWATKSEDTLLTLKLLSMGQTGTYYDSPVVVSPRRLMQSTESLHKWCRDENMKSYTCVGGKRILCPVEVNSFLVDISSHHVHKTAQVKSRRIMKRLLIQSCFEVHPEAPLTQRLGSFMAMCGKKSIMIGWDAQRKKYQDMIMSRYATTADRYEALQNLIVTEEQDRIIKGGNLIHGLLLLPVRARYI